MTINPKDAKPDQPFKVAVGGRRYTAQRVDPKDDSEQWRLLVPVPSNMSPWKDDEQVSIIAPLVPARNVTRDDLPSRPEVTKTFMDAPVGVYGLDAVLDAVVAHLNENGGVPADPKLSVEGVEEARGRMSSVYPGWRHVPVSMPMNPTYGKCCEEAQLTANELARRNEELEKAEGEIAALTKDRDRAEARYRETLERLVAVDVEWNEMRKDRNGQKVRAEKAEAERDELQADLDAERSAHDRTQNERDEARAESERMHRDCITAENERDELKEIIRELKPAEGWPDWLGPKIDPGDFEVYRDALENIRVDGEYFCGRGATPETVRDGYAPAVWIKAKSEAVARFIESEQAKRDDETSDEDQRVEEQAKRLYLSTQREVAVAWESLTEPMQNGFRAAIRAGWTPPNPSAKGDGLDRTTDGGRVESEGEQ